MNPQVALRVAVAVVNATIAIKKVDDVVQGANPGTLEAVAMSECMGPHDLAVAAAHEWRTFAAALRNRVSTPVTY